MRTLRPVRLMGTLGVSRSTTVCANGEASHVPTAQICTVSDETTTHLRPLLPPEMFPAGKIKRLSGRSEWREFLHDGAPPHRNGRWGREQGVALCSMSVDKGA